jgi:predicted secreted protein
VASPRRWLIVSLTACSLAACGQAKHTAPPPPRLPAALAHRLAVEADAVHGRTAALRLQRRVIEAINAGRVPAALQEELSSRANAVTAQPSRARSFAAWLRRH